MVTNHSVVTVTISAVLVANVEPEACAETYVDPVAIGKLNVWEREPHRFSQWISRSETINTTLTVL